jgi:hypothetical protein
MRLPDTSAKVLISVFKWKLYLINKNEISDIKSERTNKNKEKGKRKSRKNHNLPFIKKAPTRHFCQSIDKCIDKWISGSCT